jgi:AraC family transcriptional regulator
MPSQRQPFFGLPRETITVAGFGLRMLDALPDREIGQHGHAEAHAVLALSGRYVSDAAPGDEGSMLIYNPPGLVHRDRFAAHHGSITGRFIGLTIGADVQRSLDEIAPPPARAIRIADPAALAMVAQAWRLAASDHADQMLDAEFSCLSFMAEASGYAAHERHAPRWVATARIMLAEARAVPLTIGALAGAAGVHPVHFARVYRAVTGESPGVAQRRLQVGRAAAAVRHTRRTLADIAMDHGFSDQPHMTRAFRSVLGVTPGALRRG